MRCLICDKQPEPASDEHADDRPYNQPHHAVVFRAHGQHGSAVFDPMDGTYLEINVCDDCLTSRADQVLLGQPRHRPLVVGSISGLLVDIDYRPWPGNGDGPAAGGCSGTVV